ncbi:MAG: hypothetical protein VX589_04300 [Myxococcota bacterium]|nr:hypothetical protein [Myxococcota bacterium]
MRELRSGAIEFVCGDETSVTSTPPTTGVKTRTAVIEPVRFLSLPHEFADALVAAQYHQAGQLFDIRQYTHTANPITKPDRNLGYAPSRTQEAELSNGNIVILRDNHASALALDDNGILGQIVNRELEVVADAVRVDTTSTASAHDRDVSMVALLEGGFVIVRLDDQHRLEIFLYTNDGVSQDLGANAPFEMGLTNIASIRFLASQPPKMFLR